MQTTNNRNQPGDFVHETPSHTDILAKYQQKKQERSGGQYGQNRVQSSCFRDSLYILFAWLGFLSHITVAVVLSWRDKHAFDHFYRDHSLIISPAHWNTFCFINFQWAVIMLWIGISLCYLSLIAAEHSVKIFDGGFYIALSISNLLLSCWYLLTVDQRYWSRFVVWFLVEICLFYAQFILQKHLYVLFPVEMVPVDPFRLDSMPSPLDESNGDKFSDIPPISISNGNGSRRKPKQTMTTRSVGSGTTSRNINAILHRGGSLNSSPVSMSMNRMFHWIFSLFFFCGLMAWNALNE